ncbi:acyl-CoA reductase-like NAD-dependent aldehyde dehydrogenase [Rhodoglobus vestalii]|uniref:Acyl-CoA reductase-like NAD-dependent aldehyde dehydrogenase n=1 Tax=Rhodoglobus vestalii TaxID=193384 RepID=A0A8H2K9H6_9MICO|nr:aldehyde dehydrogenase family protein [Rhodoglobus vestalii]TQO20582.1 acyl-CoA reductase-like NAD-dependent aldehyde dehydrogenase [Rhodoglobus vestalii]
MTTLEEYHSDNFIDGGWVASNSTDHIDVTDPTSEEIWGQVPSSNLVDIDAAVGAASRAFHGSGWSDIGAAGRAVYMVRLADELETRADRMAAIITSENGTAITETLLAAGHAARMLRYYAGLASLVDQDDERPFPGNDALYTQVLRQPRGVAALIAPWNFPVALVMVKLAPALIAGCTVVIKPASETPLDLRVLMEAATAAGIPPGVINLVTCGNDVAGALVEHPLVAKVAFTGSTEVGRMLAEKCGRLLRPVTLELGGKSASIVMEDANLDYFASMVNRTCLRNTGQTCYNSTRILAPRSIYDEVVDAVVGIVEATPIGDPFDPATVYGPSASAKQRDRVESYIKIGIEEGARVAVGGGGRPDHLDRGYFVRPTVFAGVSNEMRIAREEIFGPVLVVIPFDDANDAIRISNDSPFGLGGSIFTEDVDAAAAMAARLETGSVGINFYGSNQAAPFGGWKDSGIGMEYGPEAINAYSRMKSIHRQR